MLANVIISFSKLLVGIACAALFGKTCNSFPNPKRKQHKTKPINYSSLGAFDGQQLKKSIGKSSLGTTM